MTRLYRSQTDRKVAGLCGGIAERFQLDANLLRLIVVIAAIFSGGTVILIYIVACMVIPKEPYTGTPYYGPSNYGANQQGPSYQGAQRGQAAQPQHYTGQTASVNIDEMMKDIEQKAMRKEIEQLRARINQYEKGEN